MKAHDGSSAAAGRRAAVQDREDALVARLTALGPALDGEPDPAFRAAIRARLVAMAAVRTPGPEPARGRRRWLTARPVETDGAPWRGRLRAGLAGAAVGVTALAALVGVSTGAQPGDPLYGLKRGTEQTQLALAGDSRGETLLDFATTRLHELDRLLSDGATALPAAPAGGGNGAVLAAPPSPELVIGTLRTMDAQTVEGTAWLTARAVHTRDASLLDHLVDWSVQQSDGLSALVPKAPDGSRDAMGNSLDRLGEVRGRAADLQDSLACPAGPAVAGTDALGPRPGACDEPTTPPSAAGGATGPPGSVPPVAPPTTAPPASGGPAAPTTGGGSGGGAGGTGGSGGAPTAPTVPPTTLPSLPSPSLPSPSPPAPSLPSLTLPSLPLPGPGTPAPGPSTGPSSSSSPPLVSICLGPVTIGNC